MRDRPPLDPLTQTVELLRPTAFTWKVGEVSGDWSLRFPANGGVAFTLIATGGCRLDLPGRQTEVLGPGDFILLAAPPDWTLSDGAPTASLDFRPAFQESGPVRTYVGPASATPGTRLVGGHFRIDEANAGLLGELMPTVVRVRSSEPGAGRLRAILGLIDDEALSDRPGRSMILQRLLEIMLVEAIRHQAGDLGQGRRGLLAGLGDRQVGAALRAIHGDIQKRWTVEQLAAIAGTSRSVLAERFTRIVGLPPIDYLLRWRMALAKDALAKNALGRGEKRLAEVAFACGYQSASAFSTAFTRTVGCSPARYAAERRAEAA